MDAIAMPGPPAIDGRASEGGGQSANSQLLRLVARANANVAELMRLSDYVPRVFYLEGQDAQLYDLILQDYAYFQRADLIEEKIAADTVRRTAVSHPSAASACRPRSALQSPAGGAGAAWTASLGSPSSCRQTTSPHRAAAAAGPG